MKKIVIAALMISFLCTVAVVQPAEARCWWDVGHPWWWRHHRAYWWHRHHPYWRYYGWGYGPYWQGYWYR
jgi:hypothetical protein